jgi:hypothetical protein
MDEYVKGSDARIRFNDITVIPQMYSPAGLFPRVVMGLV